MDFELEIRKTNVGIRINIFEIFCVPIFRQLWLFRLKFSQKWIWGSEFWKSKFGCRISSSKISCVSIFRQNGQLWLFRAKFAQKGILGSEFRKCKSGSVITMSANFQTKQATLSFSAQICPKMDFRFLISKFYVWICNQHLQYTMNANFQTNRTALDFLA